MRTVDQTASTALGIVTVAFLLVVTLWALGRVRWAFSTPSRVVGVLGFVVLGGYLVYDVWWMQSMYGVWWWDHVTHTVSAAMVASIGFTVAWALESRADTIPDGGTPTPSRRVAVATLGVVIASALLWEIYEVYAPVVVVYGVEDTVKDVFFDLLGATLVVRFGDRFLGGVTRDVRHRWTTPSSG